MSKVSEASTYAGVFGTKAGILAAMGAKTSTGSAAIAAGSKILAAVGIASNPLTLGIAGAVVVGTVVFGLKVLD